MAGRQRMQKEVVGVLRRYLGRYVTVGVVYYELQDKQPPVLVTRETIRKWVLEFGCVMVDPAPGIYKVPDKAPSRKRADGQGDGQATVPEAEPDESAEVEDADTSPEPAAV